MQNKKEVAFVTGSRADYGIMRRYLNFLHNDVSINLSILVTGALLNYDYGHQVELIYNDKFFVAAEIELDLNSSSNAAILRTMSQALERFGEYFQKKKYDLLIILGDRYEMLSVATAAAMQRIPILHIHGGEATYGNYDEFIRHSITKMSLFHFTATEEYKNRVVQLGESPDRVFNLGALGAENCLFIEDGNVPQDVKNLPRKKYFVILFHPETLTNTDVCDQVNQLLNAIEPFVSYDFVFLGTNADTYSHLIRAAIREFVEAHENAIYYENLHTDAYHFLLKNAICLVGNSSSGIIEAPSLGIYTINIGDRQAGRVRGNSVIDVRGTKEDIYNAIKYVIQVYNDVKPVNPYYKSDTAHNYYLKTVELLNEPMIHFASEPKIFYDNIVDS